MRQALDDVALGAVITRERNERASRIVDATTADLQLIAQLVEELPLFVRIAIQTVDQLWLCRRKEQIVRLRRSPHQSLPPAEQPLADDLRQRRMHRYFARPASLRPLDAPVLEIIRFGNRQLAERLHGAVVVADEECRQLAEARTGQEQRRVDGATVFGDARVGDQALDLGVIELRRRTPRRIFVLFRRQIAFGQHARIRGQPLVDADGVLEHGTRREECVAHRARRQLLFVHLLHERVDDFPSVARTHVVENEITEGLSGLLIHDDGQDVQADACVVIFG